MAAVTCPPPPSGGGRTRWSQDDSAELNFSQSRAVEGMKVTVDSGTGNVIAVSVAPSLVFQPSPTQLNLVEEAAIRGARSGLTPGSATLSPPDDQPQTVQDKPLRRSKGERYEHRRKQKQRGMERSPPRQHAEREQLQHTRAHGEDDERRGQHNSDIPQEETPTTVDMEGRRATAYIEKGRELTAMKEEQRKEKMQQAIESDANRRKVQNDDENKGEDDDRSKQLSNKPHQKTTPTGMDTDDKNNGSRDDKTATATIRAKTPKQDQAVRTTGDGETSAQFSRPLAPRTMTDLQFGADNDDGDNETMARLLEQHSGTTADGTGNGDMTATRAPCANEPSEQHDDWYIRHLTKIKSNKADLSATIYTAIAAHIAKVKTTLKNPTQSPTTDDVNSEETTKHGTQSARADEAKSEEKTTDNTKSAHGMSRLPKDDTKHGADEAKKEEKTNGEAESETTVFERQAWIGKEKTEKTSRVELQFDDPD